MGSGEEEREVEGDAGVSSLVVDLEVEGLGGGWRSFSVYRICWNAVWGFINLGGPYRMIPLFGHTSSISPLQI